jgi:probable phosphoglycerate mutase
LSGICGVIGQALALATGSRPFAFIGADNGSVSELVVASATWVVRSYNDASRLDNTRGDSQNSY